MPTPTKNSAEEAESPIMCVVVTEWLQRVVFLSMSGNWLNLGMIQNRQNKWVISYIINLNYVKIKYVEMLT